MPATDDLIPDFDGFHESQAQEDFAEPIPVPAKKEKKKKRRHVPASWEEEVANPYGDPVTASPPAIHGVRLDTPPPPAAPAPELELEDIPVDEPIEEDAFAWGHETAPVEAPEPSDDFYEPHSARALPSPVRSPTLATVKPALASASPPYRPASLHKPPPQYGSHDRPNQSKSQPAPQRRESFARSPVPRLYDPPPPHMPQPHFFGVPDLGLGVLPRVENSKAAGSDGYCCRFDTFSDAGDVASARRARDALLVGSEGGLEVYRVLPDKMEVAGRLEGLRGAVIDAKVLPHTSTFDFAAAVRPLVAVIVHGVLGDEREDTGDSGRDQQAKDTRYQTTVEIYSLQKQQHIATLYRSTTVKMEQPVHGHLSLPPTPLGDLSLDAAGRFVVLTSGKSGEVFVFLSDAGMSDQEMSFRCVAKYWTALQTRTDVPRPASAGDGGTTNQDQQGRIPLMSLSVRWLAIVPPYTSPGSSLQGSPTISESHPQPYGVGTHTAPLQPPLSCEVTGIDTEGTLSWLSRRAAQGLVTASQRGYEMSVQGWKELTYPSQPSAQQKSNPETNMFPPTNAPAEDPRRLAKEPALISIIDLQWLLSAEEQRLKQAPAPLATFALVEGCNYLAFSSDGLRLLTSNRKGEISSIWDLAHVAHGSMKPSSGDGAEAERVPHVKLVHRIARSSPSVIVDSVWSRDGDWVALLTTHGTVHLHEAPFTPPRKRKRRSTFTTPTPDKAEPSLSLSHGVSPPSNGLFGSIRSWSQSVSTHVSTVKAQYALPTTFAGFRSTAAAARTAGSRAVAKGLSQGFTAAKSGASDMWHAEDNKVRLKTLPEGSVAKPGCMRWVQRPSGSGLALVYGGTVVLHPVQRVVRQKGEAMVSGLKRDRYAKTFPLPRISTSREGSSGSGKVSSCVREGPHGFWSLRTVPVEGFGKMSGRRTSGGAGAAAATTNANEVETNPPYCPFHVDPRVSIYAFEESGYASQINVFGHPHPPPDENAVTAFKTRGQGQQDVEQAWLFGQPLPPSTKLNERSPHQEDRTRDRRPGTADADIDADAQDVDTGDEMAGMIESRLTIHPASTAAAADGEGQQQREEIRVQSRRKGRREGRRRSWGRGGDGAVEGEFVGMGDGDGSEDEEGLV
ncbi:hypothetical protein LTR91_004408 [Friedmanniomyces endolithicus]|uniref:BCAS3 domain-containing protein n=1 Tax=Friedmanniomyces endolithicus TaxID=329885 RepID=A0AAN6KVU2_9PEZI|nr:hypothetical protein LTR75_001222 [Friedmanniomyces endolithicus]KAK0853354.1 hypothetical protein LTR03_002915 [Friedmanniomyces endolithicus]KAK0872672.1 hypothetical protein LTS02_001247 [Friedmanniomyces endolithicus]KAK0922577.1 hypothetical protein LTR57_007585 [Friedmanniomyces endolithicus]KAK0971394.1 hypothetical protein LTS01_015351 [Friedmanniomyces endolithicus]